MTQIPEFLTEEYASKQRTNQKILGSVAIVMVIIGGYVAIMKFIKKECKQ